jgi:type II secretory pathway pseudopilin PulG
MSNNERGFTLIEATIAMMVCTIGLIAMAELLAVTLRMQQLGRNSTSAARLAQDQIDRLTIVTNPALLCGGSLDSDVTNYSAKPLQDNGTPDDPSDDTLTKGYKVRWVVSGGPDTSPNLRTVTVRVIPDVKDSRTSTTYNLTTVIRRGSTACP